MKLLLIANLIILFGFININSKILIITQAYNKPHLITLQKKTLDAFLEDDFEYIVFNDATNKALKNEINQVCAELGIRTFRVPQEIHDWPYMSRRPGQRLHSPSVRNSNVVQFSLDTLGFRHKDIVFTIDSDLFLIKNFCIRDFMQDVDIAGRLMKHKYPYLWIGMVFMDMRSMPDRHSIDFNCDAVHGLWTDAGGWTYFYLNKNKNAKVKYIGVVPTIDLICNQCKKNSNQNIVCNHNTATLLSKGFDKNQIELIQKSPMHKTDNYSNFEFLCNKTFLHYGGGTRHGKISKEQDDRKMEVLNNYINTILSDASC